MSVNKTAASKTYNVLPGTKMGILTTDYLETIARVARKYDIPFLKITSAQRLAIVGHAPEAVERIWHDLGQATGPRKPVGVHYIQACPGSRWCRYGRQDSLALGEKLEKQFVGLSLPGKTKVGVSGCPLNCCEGYVRDLGIFGKKSGWTLVFGGNGGGVPRIGDIIAQGLSDAQVLDLAGRCLDFYREHARKRERTARFMERTSLEKFKEAVS
ncbi:MAG: NAD(P)/FAD-dependent oxidoreductase [Desulfobacterales bacterium]|nr:NAD(P)/FAD-dependent oxidoreductase [Desulfobacterales bacterium]